MVAKPFDPVTLDPRSHKNSFDTMRFIASSSVFLGHQLGLAGRGEFHIGRIAFSSIALYVFFALGGYLIFQSLMRDSSVRRYATARALRLCPAYFTNVCFCVLFGAAVTNLPVAQYFMSADTWRYFSINMLMVVPPTQFMLPGVFEESAWRSINGAMWTIKYEVLVYIAPFILYHLSGAKYRKLIFGAFAALLTVNYAYVITMMPLPEGLSFFADYNYYNVSRLFYPFFVGAWLACCEPLSLRARGALIGFACILIALAYNTELVRVGTILLLTLLVVEIGKSRLLYSKIYNKIGDLSYGIFLFAYPIQNYIWTYHSAGRNFYVVSLVTYAIIFLCAILSWRFVEKPMLARKPVPTRKTNSEKTGDAPAIAVGSVSLGSTSPKHTANE